MRERASLVDSLTAVAEELLFGAAAKVKREESVEWSSGMTGLGLVPTSVATGKPYRGRWNKLFLRLAQAWGGKPAWDKDGPDKPYLTGWRGAYKQWEALGAQVRKGEKASHIYVPRTFFVCEEHGDDA